VTEAPVVRGERPRPAAVRDHPNAGWFAVATVCFGAFMGQLDASIVTLTFPALQHEFGRPLAAVQWVSLAYLLGLVGLLAAAGRVADAAGRKRMYLWGFAVFTLASVACGVAPGLGWLVGFRVVQAAGAAMLQANSVALVVGSVPRERMRAALGVQAAAQALGLALGPAVGGLLVAAGGWRWVFLVNVPVGVVGWLSGQYLLPRTRHRTALARFDGAGLALLVASSTALLLALSAVSGLGVPAWGALALVALAGLAGAGFVVRERSTTSPLVDLRLVRPRPVSLGLLGALAGYLVLFGPLALFPQVLSDHRTAGLLLTCLPAGFGVAAVGATRVLPRGLGLRGLAAVGTLAALAGCAGLALTPHTPAVVGPLLALVGLGLGVFVPANNAAIMGAVPERASASGGGLVNMARGLGTALGVALVAFSLHAGGARGAAVALWALAAVAAAGGVAAVAATRDGAGARPEEAA
jgi:EmrB/QacA subfamily drug resistance transporter